MGEPKQEVLKAYKSVNRLQMTMGDWQGQHLASGSALWFHEWESCGRGEGQVW